MVSAQVILTQPLKEGRQFVAQTGSGHHLLLDDAHGATGPKPIELVATALAGCTAFDVITIPPPEGHRLRGARRGRSGGAPTAGLHRRAHSSRRDRIRYRPGCSRTSHSPVGREVLLGGSHGEADGHLHYDARNHRRKKRIGQVMNGDRASPGAEGYRMQPFASHSVRAAHGVLTRASGKRVAIAAMLLAGIVSTGLAQHAPPASSLTLQQ